MRRGMRRCKTRLRLCGDLRSCHPATTSMLHLHMPCPIQAVHIHSMRHVMSCDVYVMCYYTYDYHTYKIYIQCLSNRSHPRQAWLSG